MNTTMLIDGVLSRLIRCKASCRVAVCHHSQQSAGSIDGMWPSSGEQALLRRLACNGAGSDAAALTPAGSAAGVAGGRACACCASTSAWRLSSPSALHAAWFSSLFKRRCNFLKVLQSGRMHQHRRHSACPGVLSCDVPVLCYTMHEQRPSGVGNNSIRRARRRRHAGLQRIPGAGQLGGAPAPTFLHVSRDCTGSTDTACHAQHEVGHMSSVLCPGRALCRSTSIAKHLSRVLAPLLQPLVQQGHGLQQARFACR